MKLSRQGRPWLCAAKEAGRYGTEHPFLTTLRDGRRVLAATDGRRLVLLPVECEEYVDHEGRTVRDSDGVVTREVLQAAGKARPKSCGDTVYVNANGALEALPGPVTFPRPDLGGRSLPDVEGVIPKGEPEYRITFNARYLAEVAQAMGCESVTLELHGAGMPMLVLPNAVGGERDCSPVPGARGLLMPIKQEGSGRVERKANPKRAAAAAAREAAAVAQDGGAP